MATFTTMFVKSSLWARGIFRIARDFLSSTIKASFAHCVASPFYFLTSVFIRFVARSPKFFNQTHYRVFTQTHPYSSTGACYFQSKIMHKNYR